MQAFEANCCYSTETPAADTTCLTGVLLDRAASQSDRSLLTAEAAQQFLNGPSTLASFNFISKLV